MFDGLTAMTSDSGRVWAPKSPGRSHLCALSRTAAALALVLLMVVSLREGLDDSENFMTQLRAGGTPAGQSVRDSIRRAVVLSQGPTSPLQSGGELRHRGARGRDAMPPSLVWRNHTPRMRDLPRDDNLNNEAFAFLSTGDYAPDARDRARERVRRIRGRVRREHDTAETSKAGNLKSALQNQLLAQKRLAGQAQKARKRVQDLSRRVREAELDEKILLGAAERDRAKKSITNHRKDSDVWDSLTNAMTNFDAGGSEVIREAESGLGIHT